MQKSTSIIGLVNLVELLPLFNATIDPFGRCLSSLLTDRGELFLPSCSSSDPIEFGGCLRSQQVTSFRQPSNMMTTSTSQVKTLLNPNYSRFLKDF